MEEKNHQHWAASQTLFYVVASPTVISSVLSRFRELSVTMETASFISEANELQVSRLLSVQLSPLFRQRQRP